MAEKNCGDGTVCCTALAIWTPELRKQPGVARPIAPLGTALASLLRAAEGHRFEPMPPDR